MTIRHEPQPSANAAKEAVEGWIQRIGRPQKDARLATWLANSCLHEEFPQICSARHRMPAFPQWRYGSGESKQS